MLLTDLQPDVFYRKTHCTWTSH